MSKRTVILAAFGVPLLMMGAGCASMRRAALDDASTGLAESAALAFAQESDLQLAAEAMPFALKTLDMLALQQPGNRAVLLAAARAYIQYSHAFVEWPLRRDPPDDWAAQEAGRNRAAQLYLRGSDYAAAALSVRFPDAPRRLREEGAAFLERPPADEAVTLYWWGAGWAAAIAAQPSRLAGLTELPLVEAIMRRALVLNPSVEDGALHEFFVAFEAGRGAAAGGSLEAAEHHFHEAVARSGQRRASPYVTMATTVMIQRQDATGFRRLLEAALALDLQASPDDRLANTLSRDKAQWYLDRMDDFFLLTEDEP